MPPVPGAVGRISKFSPDGKFIKSFGTYGYGASQFRGPHSLAMDSKGRLFVADRGNRRIQIFDQEGKHLDTWYQFSRISGLYIDRNDTLYAIDSESDDNYNPGWRKGLRVGSARTGEVWYFVPEHVSRQASGMGGYGSMGEGVAVDGAGQRLRRRGRTRAGRDEVHPAPEALNPSMRVFRRSPGVSLAAILTLAVGIGPTVAMFTLVHAVLIQPLPYSEPERIVTAAGRSMGGRVPADAAAERRGRRSHCRDAIVRPRLAGVGGGRTADRRRRTDRGLRFGRRAALLPHFRHADRARPHG